MSDDVVSKFIRINERLCKDLQAAQVALCSRFVECGDKDGAGCTCFPDGGPYANAVPKNARAEAAEAAPSAAQEENGRLQSALEQIALLDEADGHELTRAHAHQAIAIATTALGKHSSQVFAEHAAALATQSQPASPRGTVREQSPTISAALLADAEQAELEWSNKRAAARAIHEGET